MKIRLAFVVALLLVAVALLPFFRPASVIAQSNPQNGFLKWEYKIVNTPANEQNFNALGAEGWELCVGIGPYSTNNNPVTFIFKRINKK